MKIKKYIVCLSLCLACGWCEAMSSGGVFEEKFGFRSILAPPQEEDIAKVEKELGAKFPVGYRAFLAQWNGGIFRVDPPSVQYDGEDDSALADVTLLFGVGPHRNSAHILAHTNRTGLDFSKRVPRNILAIGNGQGSERFCISLEGEDLGRIYLWQPLEDWEEGESVQTYEYLIPVAKNFEEFWGKIELRD